MNNGKAWLLVWHDHNFTEGRVEDVYELKDYVIRSVGFLVGENSDWYYLAQSLDNDATPCEVLSVMKATVITKTPLWEELERS